MPDQSTKKKRPDPRRYIIRSSKGDKTIITSGDTIIFDPDALTIQVAKRSATYLTFRTRGSSSTKLGIAASIRLQQSVLVRYQLEHRTEQATIIVETVIAAFLYGSGMIGFRLEKLPDLPSFPHLWRFQVI